MLKDINVMAVDSDGFIQIGLTNTTTNGVAGVAQLVLIRLNTQFGSNFYNTVLGSDLHKIMAGGYTPDKKEELRTEFIEVIKKIEGDIIEEQSLDDTLVPTEKLKEIKILSVEYDLSDYSWDIKVKVLTEGNNSFIFNNVWT